MAAKLGRSFVLVLSVFGALSACAEKTCMGVVPEDEIALVQLKVQELRPGREREKERESVGAPSLLQINASRRIALTEAVPGSCQEKQGFPVMMKKKQSDGKWRTYNVIDMKNGYRISPGGDVEQVTDQHLVESRDFTGRTYLQADPRKCFAAAIAGVERWCNGGTPDYITQLEDKYAREVEGGIGGADLVKVAYQEGWLQKAFVPEGVMGSFDTDVREMCNRNMPSWMEIAHQVWQGNPVIVGMGQATRTGLSAHAVVIVGALMKGKVFVIADPGVKLPIHPGSGYAIVDKFPSTWDETSRTVLPSGYNNWGVQKVIFTTTMHHRCDAPEELGCLR